MLGRFFIYWSLCRCKNGWGSSSYRQTYLFFFSVNPFPDFLIRKSLPLVWLLIFFRFLSTVFFFSASPCQPKTWSFYTSSKNLSHIMIYTYCLFLSKLGGHLQFCCPLLMFFFATDSKELSTMYVNFIWVDLTPLSY